MSDQGHPGQAPGGPGPFSGPAHRSRDPAPVPREMHVKVSAYGECTVGPRGTIVVEGWEEGLVQGGRSALVSPPPIGGRLGAPGTPLVGLEGRARRLLEEAVAHLPAHRDRLHVRLGRARVEEVLERRGGPPRTWGRVVVSGEILLGERPLLPAWSRVAPLPPGDAGWPAGFVPAVARAVADPPVEDLPAERLPLALDVFALADVLRAEAARWAAGHPRPGAQVIARHVLVDDPGFAFPAQPVDRDGEGEPVRPLPVVRDGRLLLRPRTLAEERRGEGRSTGSSVRASWRDPSRAGWRFLRVRILGPRATWPPRVRLVTRTMIAAGHLLVGGVILEEGVPRARWGLRPAPPPSAWLHALGPSLDVPVPDGSGLPVSVPPVLVEEDLLP